MTVQALQGRSFDIGRALSRLGPVIGDNAVSFAVLGLAFSALPDALFAAWRVVSPAADPGSLQGLYQPGELFVTGLCALFLSGGVIAATVATLQGSHKDLAACFTAGGTSFGRLFGIGMLANLGIGLGCLLLLVPGLILWSMWAVAQPIAVVEGKGVTDSLTRSQQLTAGNRVAVLGTMVIGVVGGLLILTALGAAVGAVESFGRPIQLVGDVVVIPLLGAVYSIGIYALQACVYAELRAGRGDMADTQVAAVFS